MCRIFSWDVLVKYYTHTEFGVDYKYCIRTHNLSRVEHGLVLG